MNRRIDQLVETVLYEGHILYPYRPSSGKNRLRFTFGRVYPEIFSQATEGREPCRMQTQCLARATGPSPRVRGEVRFLHPSWRDAALLETPLASWSPGDALPPHHVAASVEAGGTTLHSWQEAIERRVAIDLPLGPEVRREIPFAFPAHRSAEPVPGNNNGIAAFLLRRVEAMRGSLEISCEDAGGGLLRLTVRIVNRSAAEPAELASAETVLPRTFASVNTILHAEDASFLSLTAPPPEAAAAAAACRNEGAWPVLVGNEARGDCDTMLSSPIILPDYPQVAPESPGSLFDSTEIDEILSLRILTLTDGEKREMRGVDETARRLLERTESLAQESMLALHGTLREAPTFDQTVFGGSAAIDFAEVGSRRLRAGDSVRIRPRARADLMDLALAGQRAIIEAVEQDAEGKVHLALVLDNDPGRDLGLKRQPGHRFFFGIDEVEPCEPEKAP